MVISVATTDWEAVFQWAQPEKSKRFVNSSSYLAKGCRSRESNTGLVHGKHEFYH
jgi:hypothetical protein